MSRNRNFNMSAVKPQPDPLEPPPSAVEYAMKIMRLDDLEGLSRMGGAGWEMIQVNTIAESANGLFYFKRGV